MAKRNIRGVKCTQTASVRDRTRMTVLRRHEWHHFVEYVLFELHVTPNAIRGMSPKAIEALVVDTVDAVELQVSGFYFLSQHVYQTKVFVLVEPSISRRKNQNFSPAVTKDK